MLVVASSSLYKRFHTHPYRYAEARRLASELGVSGTVASVLARRGYRTPEEARGFISGEHAHDASALPGVRRAAEKVAEAVGAGARITVHGDYDADGVCSVSVAVKSLRALGATVNWVLPSRFEDGYGLSKSTVERLAKLGTGLLLTVDCGVGSADEVDLAHGLGMEVVVCDHHNPGDRLPDCPIAHPRLGEYPCPELCATAVVFKLMQELYHLLERDPKELDGELELVALATVADVMPLTGENRALVSSGLRRIGYTDRPGLRALSEVSRLDRDQVRSQDVAFRLAPRINAAGRLYRADAGVELMLTEDDDRAREIARELDLANRERRDVEKRIIWQAEALRADQVDSGEDPPALVLAAEGWHPGVIGIVASRMMRRYHRPCILIALPGADSPERDKEDGGDVGRGSGRSIPAFDLHSALVVCSEHLLRFGGHRMAAGLEIEAGSVDRFRDALVANARSALTEQDLIPLEEVDAVVSGDSLGMGLAEEIEKLEPFGEGNVGVNLLVPAARISGVQSIGEGKHARFTVKSGGRLAQAVAFGCDGKLPIRDGSANDLLFHLEINSWNGTVEPRLVLQGIRPLEGSEPQKGSCESCERSATGDGWWQLLLEGFGDEDAGLVEHPRKAERREVVDVRGRGPLGAICELVSTGENVAVVCADVSRRRSVIGRELDASRFGAEARLFASKRCGVSILGEFAAQIEDGHTVAFLDYEVLPGLYGSLGSFEHVVLLDPPFLRMQAEALRDSGGRDLRRGFVHLVWGPAEVDFAEKVAAQELGLRAPVTAISKGLLEAGRERGIEDLSPDEIRVALQGGGQHPRPPRLVGRCLKVLAELGFLDLECDGGGVRLALSSDGSRNMEMKRSETFCGWQKLYKESSKFLKVALTSKIVQ